MVVKGILNFLFSFFIGPLVKRKDVVRAGLAQSKGALFPRLAELVPFRAPNINLAHITYLADLTESIE